MNILWVVFTSIFILLAFLDISLASSSDNCGRISRNSNRFFHLYPWIAQIEFERVEHPEERKTFCLGSLVNPRYVLTTAICTQGRNFNLVGVKLGGYSTEDDGALRVGIKKAVVHPQYNVSNINENNDIALLELDQEIELTDYIRPVCLPTDDVLSRTHLTAVTWGLNIRYSQQTELHTVDLPIVKQEQCAAVYATADRIVDDNVICAGGEAGKDTCRGDTGGPLMDLRTQSVVGVVSYGPYPCGKEGWPSVYTNVLKFLPWIKEIINHGNKNN